MSLSPMIVQTQIGFIVPLANLTVPSLLPSHLGHMFQSNMPLRIVSARHLLLADKTLKQIILQLLQVDFLLPRPLNRKAIEIKFSLK